VAWRDACNFFLVDASNIENFSSYRQKKGNPPMPLYEYHCDECQHEFEKMLRFSESNTLPACPQCNSAQTRKKISAVAAIGVGDSGSSGYAGGSCSPRGGFG
jgi:putative FmdB family regulatory protein